MFSYDECVNYILNIPKFHSKGSLEDVRRLLDQVYTSTSRRIIHVAGTNGKGSVCSFISSMLQSAGYHTAVFTSPHLARINERISLDGRMICDEAFVECFEAILNLVKKEKQGYHPSFFEFLFLMAMRYFDTSNADIIILETGLGGRLDATNSVRHKDLSVITKIGFDHMEYLGNSLESIAYEKAGIIAPNTPVAFIDYQDVTTDVIKGRAEKINSKCYHISPEAINGLCVTKEGIDFSVQCEYYRYDGLRVGMYGKYQALNAALAILALKTLGDTRITDRAIADGIFSTRWPGRMEELASGVYLDGAHNEDGIEAFLASVRALPCKGRRLLLFSVVSDKDYSRMISMISNSSLFDEVYVCPLESQRALKKEELVRAFENASTLKPRCFNCAREALGKLLLDKQEKDIVFAAGSLYLIGEIRPLLSSAKNRD